MTEQLLPIQGCRFSESSVVSSTFALKICIHVHTNLFIKLFIKTQFWIQHGLRIYPQCVNNCNWSFFYLYNQHVWIQHGCLSNTDAALDPSSSIIKRWCMTFLHNQSKKNVCTSTTGDSSFHLPGWREGSTHDIRCFACKEDQPTRCPGSSVLTTLQC